MKTRSRHIDQMNTPTGIIELQLGKEDSEKVCYKLYIATFLTEKVCYVQWNLLITNSREDKVYIKRNVTLSLAMTSY